MAGLSSAARKVASVQRHDLSDDAGVVLALAGSYRQRGPHPLLRPYAAFTWSYHKKADAQRPAFVPHGLSDVLWIDGKPWLGGTYRTAVIEQATPDSVVVGVALRPGIVARWTGVAAADLVEVRLPLAAIFPALAAELVDAVSDASDPAIIAVRIEETIARELARLEPPANSYTSIKQALEPQDFASRTTRQIADSLGASERTLRRRCVNLFGYGPKTLERVLRMQRFLGMGRQSPHANVAALAHAAGYSDQPHLTREARVLTGLTPKSILAQFSINPGARLAEAFKTRC